MVVIDIVEAGISLKQSCQAWIRCKIASTDGRSAGPSPTWCRRTIPAVSISTSPPRWKISPSDFCSFFPFNSSFRYTHHVLGPQMSQKPALSMSYPLKSSRLSSTSRGQVREVSSAYARARKPCSNVTTATATFLRISSASCSRTCVMCARHGSQPR